MNKRPSRINAQVKIQKFNKAQGAFSNHYGIQTDQQNGGGIGKVWAGEQARTGKVRRNFLDLNSYSD